MDRNVVTADGPHTFDQSQVRPQAIDDAIGRLIRDTKMPRYEIARNAAFAVRKQQDDVKPFGEGDAGSMENGIGRRLQ